MPNGAGSYDVNILSHCRHSQPDPSLPGLEQPTPLGRDGGYILTSVALPLFYLYGIHIYMLF